MDEKGAMPSSWFHPGGEGPGGEEEGNSWHTKEPYNGRNIDCEGEEGKKEHKEKR